MRTCVIVIVSLAMMCTIAATSFAQAGTDAVKSEKLGADIAAKIAKENQISIDLFKQIQASEEARALFAFLHGV